MLSVVIGPVRATATLSRLTEQPPVLDPQWRHSHGSECGYLRARPPNYRSAQRRVSPPPFHGGSVKPPPLNRASVSHLDRCGTRVHCTARCAHCRSMLTAQCSHGVTHSTRLLPHRSHRLLTPYTPHTVLCCSTPRRVRHRSPPIALLPSIHSTCSSALFDEAGRYALATPT